MGLDFAAVFKEPLSYKGEKNKQFTPFSRALSNFFYANYYGEDSTLEEIEQLNEIQTKFLIAPNLHEYQVDEMQLEFAEGERLDELIKEQKELKNNSHEGWCNIPEYLDNINIIINELSNSNKLSKLKEIGKNWSNYIHSGEFVNDLIKLKELLEVAKKENQTEFSFEIY